MDFRLFPQPRLGRCTPFVEVSSDRSYARYCHEGARRTRVSVTLGKNGSGLAKSGQRCRDVFGRRLPNRDRLIRVLRDLRCRDLLRYAEGTLVLPTFSARVEEAFVRTVCRQLIRAAHAARLFSEFVREYGWSADGVYCFPSVEELAELGEADWRRSGFGFKAPRLCAGIQALRRRETQGPLPGLGPWSASVMATELGKDYRFYPFWDRSGDVIKSTLKVDVQVIAERDDTLAADLYVYAASLLGTRQ